jgi:hypothetical protein
MFRNWVLVLGIVMLGFVLSGCGERMESSSYYYSPSWTSGGKVIFVKGLQSVRKDFIGSQLGSSYTETVMTMAADGTGDGVLFDATGDPPIAMSCSPVGDYVAYMNDLRDGLYRKVIIRNIAAGAHSGIDLVELAFNPGIRSFDWSNNGAQLVYCTTSEVRTINVDGSNDTLVTAVASPEFVTWKYGTRIAYVHDTDLGKVLSLVGGPDFAVSASVDKAQISSVNNNVLYGIAGTSYSSVEVGATTATPILASFAGDLPRLNATADKVVYDKAGEQSGVYVLDLATKIETKIK